MTNKYKTACQAIGYAIDCTSALEVYMRRPGARLAFLLGAECSTRQGGAKPLIEQAAQACRDAIAALDGIVMGYIQLAHIAQKARKRRETPTR